MKVLTLSTSPIEAPGPFAPTVMSSSQNLPTQPLLSCHFHSAQPGESNHSSVTVTAVVCSHFWMLLLKWIWRDLQDVSAGCWYQPNGLLRYLVCFQVRAKWTKQRMKDECERSKSLSQNSHTLLLFHALVDLYTLFQESSLLGVFTSDLFGSVRLGRRKISQSGPTGPIMSENKVRVGGA